MQNLQLLRKWTPTGTSFGGQDPLNSQFGPQYKQQTANQQSVNVMQKRSPTISNNKKHLTNNIAFVMFAATANNTQNDPQLDSEMT